MGPPCSRPGEEGDGKAVLEEASWDSPGTLHVQGGMGLSTPISEPAQSPEPVWHIHASHAQATDMKSLPLPCLHPCPSPVGSSGFWESPCL